MTDPFSFRLNDKEGPERIEKMNEAENRWKIDGAQVLRGLTDAFLAYIEEHGAPPEFPVRIVAAGAPPKEPEKRAKKV